MVLTATTIYLTVTLVSLGLAILMAMFDGFDFDMDVDIDVESGASMSAFSPLLVMTFLASFGAWGLVLTETTALAALPVALIGSVGAIPIWLLMWWFMDKVANRTLGAVTQESVVGSTGAIHLPIADGQFGSVTLNVNGESRSYTAITQSGGLIKQGTVVRAVSFDGLNTVCVETI